MPMSTHFKTETIDGHPVAISVDTDGDFYAYVPGTTNERICSGTFLGLVAALRRVLYTRSTVAIPATLVCNPWSTLDPDGDVELPEFTDGIVVGTHSADHGAMLFKRDGRSTAEPIFGPTQFVARRLSSADRDAYIAAYLAKVNYTAAFTARLKALQLTPKDIKALVPAPPEPAPIVNAAPVDVEKKG